MPAFSATAMAALWMIFGGSCYVVSAVFVRLLSGTYGAFELAFLRCLIGVLFVAPLIMRLGIAKMRTTQFPMHCVRTAFTYAGLAFWFLSVSLIPIADFYALVFTTPLFTILGAILFLGERAGLRTWAACAVGFAGALIILRPGFAAISLGMVYALLTGLSYAGVHNAVRVLSRKDSSLVIVAWVNVLMLPISLVPALFAWTPIALADVPMILGVGLFATWGQYGLARAVAAADARVVQPFDFFRLPVAALAGWVVFAEFPGPWTWLGAAIIFAAGYAVLMSERRAERGR
ncbi:MAG: DMT family transporter [Alphaproteobacteria bacterium]|nr:DMT family transporter [Alphaproteobacteria bacterium]